MEGLNDDEVVDDARSKFTPAELLTIDHLAVVRRDERRDVISLAVGWRFWVEKIDSDRALDWADHSVWNEYDLAGALRHRDALQAAFSVLSSELARKVDDALIGNIDGRYRSFTIADPTALIAKVAGIDADGLDWWWFRMPDSGPIVQDLASWRRRLASHTENDHGQ